MGQDLIPHKDLLTAEKLMIQTGSTNYQKYIGLFSNNYS